jgi:OPT family oligopeptide transporter
VSSQIFDNAGSIYNLSRIINPDGSFNPQAYQAYSPPFLTVSFAIAYGASFAAITALLMHAFLYHGKLIWTHSHPSYSEQLDIHARLMSVYKEVPNWWYLSIFCACIDYQGQRACVLTSFAVITFGFSLIAIEVWDTELPVWAFLFALIICASAGHPWVYSRVLKFLHSAFVFTIPVGVIQATTNLQVGLNVVTELIIGYALPGRPIAMMMFKTWGHNTMSQALGYTGDLKLGHYMKIPHRPIFYCQVVATVVSGTVQLGVQAWMFSHIEDLCSPLQKDNFICPGTHAFGTASIIVSHYSCRCFVSFANVFLLVGCRWTTASLLARSDVLRPRLLLCCRCCCPTYPVDSPPEV